MDAITVPHSAYGPVAEDSLDDGPVRPLRTMIAGAVAATVIGVAGFVGIRAAAAHANLSSGRSGAQFGPNGGGFPGGGPGGPGGFGGGGPGQGGGFGGAAPGQGFAPPTQSAAPSGTTAQP